MYKKLPEQVDAVIHSAALVNHVLPYGRFGNDDLRTNNVLSLINVPKFVSTDKIKYLHYPSTVVALTSLEELKMNECFPGASDFGENCVKVGYALSKFICEKILGQAHAKGLPIFVLRHHMLTGHSISGKTSIQRDHISRLLITSLRIGMFPQFLEYYYIGLVPFDIASYVSVKLFLNDSAEFGVYNINNPSAEKIGDLLKGINEKGYKLDLVPYEIWRNAAFKLPQSELAPFAELYTKDLLKSESFLNHFIVKQLAGFETAKLFFANSNKLKKYVPDVDVVMPDSLTGLGLQISYFQRCINKNNAV